MITKVLPKKEGHKKNRPFCAPLDGLSDGLDDGFYCGIEAVGVLTTGSCVVGLAAATALDELGSLADHLTGIEA